MKFFITLLAVTALAHAEITEDDKKAWQEFKLQHGKLFLSPGKETQRMHTFLDNKKKIEHHNEKFAKGEASYVAAINKYSDLTPEAFLQRFGGVAMPPETRHHESHKKPGNHENHGNHGNNGKGHGRPPPRELDLTKRFRKGEWKVRDQLTCGSCWTFSTAAAVEYAYWRQTNYLGDLAEQQLVDCVYSYGGCRGGWMPTAMEHLAKNGGFAYEKDYPYTGVWGTCQEKQKQKSVWLNPDTPWVQIKDDDEAVKEALDTYGVLSVCVDASEWQPYKQGVFRHSRVETPYCSHAVALVGYGFDERGEFYWKIRNSWSDSWWGEDGNMRLSGRRTRSGKIEGGIMLNHAYRPVMYGEKP